jgi:hypothetical protein
MSIDPKRATDRVWSKLMRSPRPRIVFISLAYGGRVLTVAYGGEFQPPAGRIIGVYDQRADPAALQADITEALAHFNLLPSKFEQIALRDA